MSGCENSFHRLNWLFNLAIHCTALIYIALYCTALYCTMLYCMRVYCTVLIYDVPVQYWSILCQYLTEFCCNALIYAVLYWSMLYCAMLDQCCIELYPVRNRRSDGVPCFLRHFTVEFSAFNCEMSEIAVNAEYLYLVWR